MLVEEQDISVAIAPIKEHSFAYIVRRQDSLIGTGARTSLKRASMEDSALMAVIETFIQDVIACRK